jgi:hypothetical protein
MLEDGEKLSVGELLDRLPQLMPTLELEGVLANPALQSDKNLNAFVCNAAKVMNDANIERTIMGWFIDAKKRKSTASAVHAGADFALNLLNGRTKQADEVWNGLSKRSQNALQAFFRALSIIGGEGGATRKLADSALGRISLSNRVVEH